MTDAPTERIWLPLPEVADRLGISTGKVRRLVEEHALMSRRVDGEPRVPADFLTGDEPVAGLRGTIILLLDCGMSEDEALDWLLASDETLGVAPVDALQQGRKTQVRHSVQLLAM